MYCTYFRQFVTDGKSYCFNITTTDCPQVQVTQDYIAQQPDELNLKTGEILNVLRKTPDGMLYIC